MSELKLQGTIKEIFDVESGTSKDGKEWAKLSFLLHVGDDKYPYDVYFTVFGADKVDKFTQYNEIGSEVSVAFNVKSREYKGRYYTELLAWGVRNANQEQTSSKPQPVAVEDTEDDLPF
jgi:hypothetical protein